MTDPRHAAAARRRLGRLAAALALAAGAGLASAHDFRAGDVVVDHPYATPTPPGARNGAVYFRAIRNVGRESDRLVEASTPAATSVEIHRTVVSNDVARMRERDALELRPGERLELRPGGFHLMLVGLRAPLAVGERFPLKLRFERGGEREVTVWVQQPQEARDAPGHRH